MEVQLSIFTAGDHMSHLDDDVKTLHSMGYAQELSRRMGGFQSFAISFSIICIISGGLASFPIAMSTAGPFAATTGWIIGGVYALIVAAYLGQIASAYPTAGSLYHWSSILGGRFWGWATAYVNLLGLMFVIPAVNVILYTFIRDLFFAGMLGWDISTWTNTTMYLWIAGITIAQVLLNHIGIRITTILTDLSGYLILAVSVVLIAMFLLAAPHIDLASAFTFTNTTGDAGGGVAPASGWFVAFLMGLLFPLFTITGFDASAHTAEETVDAKGTVHKGMMHSVFWSLLFGFVLSLSMVLALPALIPIMKAMPGNEAIATVGDVVAKSGWGLFSTLFNSLIMPSFLGKLLAIGIIIANFLCALAAVTSTSRMIYAFARDGGLPFSNVLKSVSPSFRTPVAAIWFTGVVTFLLVVVTTPLGAFAALSTGCAMYLYVSYAMPIVAGLFAEGKTWTTFGSFRLGGLSKLFAAIVAVGTVLIIIAGHAFVPSVTTAATDAAPASFAPGLWYYSVGYMVILAVIWFTIESRRFKGPPLGAEIGKRQAEIAAAEKALAQGA